MGYHVERGAPMSIRIALAATALFAGVAWTPPARATPSARLVYSRGAGTDECPDETALRRAVALRVGYDPFFSWADKTIVASVLRAQPRGFVVRVHLVDREGIEHGTRELGTDGKCADLLDAAALAIAIAIDPLLLAPAPKPTAEPAPAPEAAPEPVVTAAGAPAPQRVETSRTSPRVGFTASAGAVVSLAVAPSPATGLSIGGEARWRQVSLAVEARVDAPASHTFSGPSGLGLDTVSLSSWLVTATVAPCVHARALIGCALGQIGSLQASTGSSTGSAPWLAAGARVGTAVPLGGGGALRLRADLLANLDRAEIWIDGAMAWKARPLCASYGLDVVVPFL
jgi:hypothetical protein